MRLRRLEDAIKSILMLNNHIIRCNVIRVVKARFDNGGAIAESRKTPRIDIPPSRSKAKPKKFREEKRLRRWMRRLLIS